MSNISVAQETHEDLHNTYISLISLYNAKDGKGFVAPLDLAMLVQIKQVTNFKTC